MVGAALVPIVAGVLTGGVGVAAAANCATTIGTPALQHMHSHNDYQNVHSIPLCSALQAGATSAEADVYLENGALQVKHGQNDTSRGTLENLYLKPLAALADNDGVGIPWIYPDWPRPFTLVVEIKDGDDVAPLSELETELARYQPMLTKVVNGVLMERSVTVLLTGNVKVDDVTTAPVQDTFANLTDDGFLTGYYAGTLPPLSLTPLVNVSWCDVEIYLRANGHPTDQNSPACAGDETGGWHHLDGLPLTTESAVEDYLATIAHRSGLKIRFWGVPDETADGATVRTDYFFTELFNGLDYVSANSTDTASATSDFAAVAGVLNSLGDGCVDVSECTLGARATVSVGRAANGNPTVTGTLAATSASWCASLELNFVNTAHTTVNTVEVPQVCGTAPKQFSVAINGSGPYAAVGTVLSSNETFEGHTVQSTDFYYL